MTEQLPILAGARQVSVAENGSNSLIGRGLRSIKSVATLSIAECDALYRKARDEYNRIWSPNEPTQLRSAFEIFQRLAAVGYGKANYPLFVLCNRYKNVEDNDTCRKYAILAFEWCQQNQDKQDAEILFDLGSMYESGCAGDLNLSLAASYYLKAAHLGYDMAQMCLGIMYSSGKGLMRDQELAFYWMEKAAEQGNPFIQDWVGELHELDRQYQKAEYWYLQAAKQKYAEAQYHLGYMYQKGLGVDQDDKLAAYWFILAAEQGDNTAQMAIGEMYFHGRGVKQDIKQAEQWCQRAAEAGDEHDKSELGLMYLFGRDVTQDANQAFNWLYKSALLGDSRGQYWLGKLYEHGVGVDQDDTQADYWYEQASQHPQGCGYDDEDFDDVVESLGIISWQDMLE